MHDLAYRAESNVKCIIYATFSCAVLCQTPERILQEKAITCTYGFTKNNTDTAV